jgi:D-alanine--poly(phosphoribitol) ligase subunit 1
VTSLWPRIAAYARDHPGRAAVVGEHGATYRELVDLAEATAARGCAGCGPGDVVGISAATSLGGLAAMLAVLSRGAAFLPLDIGSPAARQDYMLRNAGARLVIRQTAPGRLEPEPLAGGPPVPARTAYVMYTSGSTGLPKGVLVSEPALAGRLAGLARVPGFAAGSSFLALTALSFDICLAELLLPLLHGGQVVLAPPAARLDPAVFADVVARHAPDVIQATPSFWRLALAAGWTGATRSVLWCGGEPLTGQLARELSPLGRELWNLYGPTEATIWSNAWLVDPARPVSLGAALPGSTCHLVGEDGGIITEPGREGEIALGGTGLALGYVGDPPEQARFTSRPGHYLTGDRGRYRQDRSLEFLGRRDTQVKYRGHRIELGEVESALEAHTGVHQAVVFCCEPDDPARTHLAAVVAAPGAITARELRTWLAGRLPPMMLPKRITIRPSLPRTSTGKVDRVALRADQSR